MKATYTLPLFAFLLFLTSTPSIFAQSLVKNIDISEEDAKINFANSPNMSYLLEIGGPENYYFKKQLNNVTDIKLTSLKADGQSYADGNYTIQITPVFELTDEQRTVLLQLRADDDQKGLDAFRLANKLPESVDVFNIYFMVRNGKFVSPDVKEAKLNIPTTSSKWEMNHPSMYASLNTVGMDYPDLAMDEPTQINTQVINDDLVVLGSICVGLDCPATPSFGFDTQRLMENNLRIHFDDTSNSGSFPANDWRLVANETTNGGLNFFGIEDATAGRMPFRIEAAAPANALYVDNNGNIGIGTAAPVVEVQVTDGDTPTLRLDQNGSSGFGAQTWDIAGNEANFFVRDVTGGSRLPFKIRPGAGDNSLVIDNDNNIGIGVLDATQKVQIESGNLYVKSGKIGINVVPSTNAALDVLGNFKLTGNYIVTGTTTLRGDISSFMTNGATFYSAAFSPFFKLDATTGRVGIGMASAPAHLLQLGTDDAVKPNGGSWTAPSDRRLKTNIQDFTVGLEAVLKVRPVKYHYNGKFDMPTEQEFIGVIAQEMRDIAPFTIKKLNLEAPKGEEDYLAFDPSAVTYMLVNAVQEQQEMIDAQKKEIELLKARLAEVDELKQAVAQLSDLMKQQGEAARAKIDDKNASLKSEE